MVLKSYKYRLYPTKDQETLINKHIGCCRFVYNLALETKQTAYAGNRISLNCFDLIKQLADLKSECEWLKEVNSQSLQHAIINLDSAYTNFFKGRANFPRYKSKRRGNKSFIAQQSVKVKDDRLFIPKFKGGIKVEIHRSFTGIIKRAIISRTPTGKYFASVLVATNDNLVPKPKITENNTIGVDLGLRNFLITSDGEVVSNPKHLDKSISKLKFIQRKYSKNKGARTKHKLALVHEKVANQRKDFLNQVSTKLIRENQTIALETLDIKSMSKRLKPEKDKDGKYIHNGQKAKSELNGSILDAGWGMFVIMLEYKANWYGTNIIRIGQFEPSSKTCSVCGSINKDLELEDREWTCETCKTFHDRDINAAINIKNFALRNHTVCGTHTKNQNELPTLVGVLTSEASGFNLR